MRLTAFILLGAFMQLSASTMAQRVTLSQKNAPLEKVLKEIRRQTGFNILYDLSAVLAAKPVSINVKDVSIQEALQSSLAAQSLEFSLKGQTVVITERTLMDKISESVVAAEVKILVRDSLGRPLAGANVYNKTINKMYATNKEGEVQITGIPNNGFVLQISYLGMKHEEIFVDRKSSAEYLVILRAQVAVLDDISVVSTGYQKISKERAAGAYSTILAEQLEKTPAVNILERLEGKVPGVKFDIRRNAVQIRGVNSYAGAAGTPLIVVDGFPLMNSSDQATLTSLVGNYGNSIISNINIADIEQITFLKDASATSIWGSRAANGVIVIDTKKGRKKDPTLNLSYTLGISKSPSLSKLNWMNSAQYVDLEQEMVDKGFIVDPASSAASISAANNSEATEWMFRVKRGTATAAQRDAALAEISSRNGQKQIEDNLLQNAVNQQYNLSYSGGSENSTYFISGGYTKDAPLFKSNSAENVFLNANTTTELWKKRITFRTLFNYQYSRSKYNSSAIDALSVSNIALRPYDLLVDASGNNIQRNIIFRDSEAAKYTALGYLPFSYNAIDELNYSNYISKNNVLRFNAGLNGKITKWLNADLSASAQRQFLYGNTLNELNSYVGRLAVNVGTTVSNGKLVYNYPYGGKVSSSEATAYDTGFRGQLNADKTFNGVHHLNVIAGTEIRETGNTTSSEVRYGYDQDTGVIRVANPSTSYATFYGYSQTLGQNLSSLIQYRKRFLSYYSNASYAYDDKYIVTGSARFDDYTLLGLDRRNRAKPFWSVGFRWNANKENFVKDIEWIDMLALRATIGTSGVVPQGGSNITLLSVSGSDGRTSEPIATIQSPGNSDLGWETTLSRNIGFDFSVLKNRLSGSFDIYNKRTSGILANFAYNSTYGWSNLTFNSGTLSGHGYEFVINAEPVKAGMFSWQTTLNFSYNTNTVTEARYENNASSLAGTAGTVNGVPLGTLYVYRSAGLDNKGQTQIYDRNNNIIPSTTNLTPAFTKEDLVKAGTTFAPYSGGFINTFKYGQFEAGVQISYYLGHVFLKSSIDNYPTFSPYTAVLGRQEDLAYRWRNPGDEANTNVPGLTGVTATSVNRYKYSDALVRKADNIRLQQISLSYSVPKRFLPNGVIKSIALSANVRNLGILWKANKDGIDPEYVITGNFSSIPPTTSYVFGINASF